MKPGAHILSTGHNRHTIIKSDAGGAEIIQRNRGHQFKIYLNASALDALREVLG